MSEKNCIFIGGKQIGVNCLRKVLEAGVRPQLVVANMDDKGETLWHESLVKISKEAGLNTITGQKLRDTDVVDQIRKLEPEIIFCIGGMQIVPKEVLDIPKIGTINIHPALLPKYRGRYSTVHAIFNGDKYTGVTLHFMDEGLDSGPIILQQKFPIDKDDTAREVYDKFTNVGTALFEKFLSVWLSGKPIKSRPQDEKKATYYPKGLPNNGEIDWSWPGKKIYDFIRAMTFEPFGPAGFQLGNKKMVIIDESHINRDKK
ncbi:MAG: hypothetical protein A3H57_01410 [Candidatus Taylorbacteria bacterium RIFCSPLOWO2_02_FULL_43_11]|uniref:methionyl-tRNA formyltransferase n=1 Tax=Candidatus Taylorbacteria bacterium RIFCSPHIGHO2_02_FULL_43_32b TaxID=1802306 RepID=A0A1G2MLA0_9BACT|nr:MAG: hypothetical protein A3C72_01835 [Candidatus Taylorbacteria bacterium RIFCSPHIGHO2_02_FULL_43_32b]OHA35834.1 MAG: hypothetical protein A3H57_01410 [Candidatus Taylorbacteria bacterium RIFCSPLOWO2_02_FULL_43_11]